MTNLIRSTVAAAALALILGGSALAKPETVQVGNLVLTHDGGITPTKLPKRGQAPIKAFISAAIAARDGGHPPAAREAVVDLDRNVRIDAAGLPACKAGKLSSRDTAAARRVCGAAIVGTGSARVQIAFPEQPPITATTPLVMFNGGVEGRKTTLFIHAFLTVPVPAAVVTTVELAPAPGRYGTHIVVKVPPIVGGAGSLIAAELEVDRKFTAKGEKRSYLSAGCPTGRHFIKGRIVFDDGTAVNLSRILPCTPAG
jgi:hypothetical protein